jgi:hypothetical protein
MTKILFTLIGIVFILFSCSKDENQVGGVSQQQHESMLKSSGNENILAKTLLHTKWATVESIMSMAYNDLRNTVISNLDSKCNNPLAGLQAMTDEYLSWASIMHKFLLDGNYRTNSQLQNMSIDDFRNTLIALNGSNTNYTVSQLQGFSNEKNLNIAYSWWFYRMGSTTKAKIDALKNISGSSPKKFDTKDNLSIGMECLKVVKADETYTYLGVYHSQVSSGRFKLYLAGSNDLLNWTYITELGDRSHQGDIKKWGTGYLLANEQDPTSGSNNVRVRYYSSYSNLIANNASNSIVLSRNFSSSAEGTPDIREVIGSTPGSSHIVIGFHYYDNNVRDQVAIGILYHFTNWRAWKDEISNYNIQQMGFNGNFGGRSGFTHNGDFMLQEAQITSNDWSSWRMLFGDGAFYYNVNPVTPLGSVSFANPGVAATGTNSFAVTSYMPTEGNKEGERGELIYKTSF